jgi:hypothetical protein
MTRVALGVMAACAFALLACDLPPAGEVTANGAWADGEPITFRAPARLTETLSGRNDLVAMAADATHVRFRGVRLTYDPREIKVPGTYPVDPAPLGKIELYCARPEVGGSSPAPQTIEYEVSSGTIQIDTFPDRPGRMLAGHFQDVVLQRNGALILRLERGEFYVRVSLP